MTPIAGGLLAVLLNVLWTLPLHGSELVPANQPTPLGDFVAPECWKFSYGDLKSKEIYSPLYPANYPNRTECIHLLIAPEKHRIRLDFRDKFSIEKSADCKYDFLELRDGPFGYSPLKGRYCGDQFPPIIQSTSRYLWMRFHSDESIEYAGFRSVYEFYSPSDTEINETKSNHSVCLMPIMLNHLEGEITSRDIPIRHIHKANQTEGPVDCTWMMLAPLQHRLFIRFEKLTIQTPNNCEDNYLGIYDGSTAVSEDSQKLCNSAKKDLRSESNHFYIRLYAQRDFLVPYFKAAYTVFLPPVEGFCPPDHYDCGDQTCINRSLLCNGRDNCPRRIDEAACFVAPTETVAPMIAILVPHHMVILGVVSGLIVTVIIISVVITCKQKKREEANRKSPPRQVNPTSETEMVTLLNRSPRASQIGNRTEAGNHSPYMNHVTPRSILKSTSSLPPPVENHRTLARSVSNNPSENDGSELDVTEGGNFRRYLDVNNLNDDDSSPNLSTCNSIPAVVTVEHHPSPHSLSVTREGSPSPRPDLVQEERFTYPEPNLTKPLRQETLLQTKSPKNKKNFAHTRAQSPKMVKHPLISDSTAQPSVIMVEEPRHFTKPMYTNASNHSSSLPVRVTPASSPRVPRVTTTLSPRSPDITKATRGIRPAPLPKLQPSPLLQAKLDGTLKPLVPQHKSSEHLPAKAGAKSPAHHNRRNRHSVPNSTTQADGLIWQHHPV